MLVLFYRMVVPPRSDILPILWGGETCNILTNSGLYDGKEDISNARGISSSFSSPELLVVECEDAVPLPPLSFMNCVVGMPVPSFNMAISRFSISFSISKEITCLATLGLPVRGALVPTERSGCARGPRFPRTAGLPSALSAAL